VARSVKQADPGAAAAGEAAPARILRIGLGSLWLLDGLLQAQPGMFGMDMISTIMQPAATGEPAWLSGLIAWSIRLVTPHLVVFNTLVVALQLTIGVLLLIGARPRLVRVGAALGIVWALTIWLFGEGLGQLLTGSGSGLAGAPGSALLYAVAAALLLGGRANAATIGGRSVATWAAAATLALGGALALNPLFFTPLGLSSVFGQGAAMAQPEVLRAPLVWVTDVSAAHPAALNGTFVALSLLAALAVLWYGRGQSGRLILLGVLAFVFAQWWLGQDFGMPFGGMATDPNTAAPLALLLVAGASADRQHALAARATAAASRAASLAPAGLVDTSTSDV
jgi:hypothetical protein